MSGRGLVVDYGGVLTTPVRDSYALFCEREGLEVEDVRRVIRDAYRAAREDDPIVAFELGRLNLDEFERRLADVLSAGLSRPIAPEGIVRRIMGNTSPEEQMIEAVRRAREHGIRTALLSNSWGNTAYPEDLLALFDTVVISARVGLRKPNQDIFELTLDRIGLPAGSCVFVDDARPNCEAAEALGMRAILHRSPADTLPRIAELLGD